MITRRTALMVMGCTCIVSKTAIGEEDKYPGCIFFDADGGISKNFSGLAKITPGGGISNGLVILLAKMSMLFDVHVTVGYYDDPIEFPNAGASPEVVMTDGHENSTFLGNSGHDGTIGIGRHLIEQIRGETAIFGAALTAVIAHEYGHILQFKYITPQLMQMDYNYKLAAELHADFICGYAAAFRKLEQPDYPAAIHPSTQFRRGDNGNVQLIEHGTPEQRSNCVVGGFLLGQKGRLDPKEVSIKGFEFVKRLVTIK